MSSLCKYRRLNSIKYTFSKSQTPRKIKKSLGYRMKKCSGRGCFKGNNISFEML